MKVIAYYLPQYYPFKQNNEWWGEGFTEWTNVGKAKPLFYNHYQPKVPKDLGYYDLRLTEVKQKQADLANLAGITGFCYWHYWFGNGRQLLSEPILEVIRSGKPDFPFCLGWANESWKKKTWKNIDSNEKDVILIEQNYSDSSDVEQHFSKILPILKDSRYIKIDNKPIFIIYKPFLIPDIKHFFFTWNRLAKENGFTEGLFFIGHTVNSMEVPSIMDLGFNAVNVVRIGEHRYNSNVVKKIPFKLMKYKFFNRPLKLNYSFISKYFIHKEDSRDFVIPTIIPNWDHTPRSGNRGVVFHNSTPMLFKKHVKEALNIVKNKPEERQIIFLKSWNEWGEGNYMEPDLKFGKGYIYALKEAIEEFKKNKKNENNL
jgi:lipopolysaccharide biosynthesis protein